MGQTTVLIARSSDADVKRTAFEDSVISALRNARRGNVIVIPSLYHMSDPGPCLAAVGPLKHDIVYISWLHTRASYWLLHRFGIEGLNIETACASCASSETCFTSGDRTISLYRFGDFASPDACAERICSQLRSSKTQPKPLREIESPVRARWYPVIDCSLCSLCGQCHDFCLFGVYSIDDSGRTVVTAPDRCKPGCAACARICPEGAILFPLCATDEGIAGAPGKRPAASPLDVEAFFKRGEPCPLCGCSCNCARSTDGTAPPSKKVCPACGCICDEAGPCACKPHLPRKASTSGERDELDDLIDELDKLDE